MSTTPSDSPVRVGAKLRGSRLAQGMTIDQVAQASGLSKGFLSKVERDETSPSVATLVTICQVLSLPVGSLFVEPDIVMTSLDAAPLINMGGTGAVERLLSPRTQSRLQVLRSTLKPRATGGASLYTISCEIEVMHVICGEVVVRFNDRKARLSAGTTLSFPGREPHSWDNDTDEIAEVLWIMAPAAWSGSG